MLPKNKTPARDVRGRFISQSKKKQQKRDPSSAALLQPVPRPPIPSFLENSEITDSQIRKDLQDLDVTEAFIGQEIPRTPRENTGAFGFILQTPGQVIGMARTALFGDHEVPEPNGEMPGTMPDDPPQAHPAPTATAISNEAIMSMLRTINKTTREISSEVKTLANRVATLEDDRSSFISSAPLHQGPFKGRQFSSHEVDPFGSGGRLGSHPEPFLPKAGSPNNLNVLNGANPVTKRMPPLGYMPNLRDSIQRRRARGPADLYEEPEGQDHPPNRHGGTGNHYQDRPPSRHRDYHRPVSRYQDRDPRELERPAREPERSREARQYGGAQGEEGDPGEDDDPDDGSDYGRWDRDRDRRFPNRHPHDYRDRWPNRRRNRYNPYE